MDLYKVKVILFMKLQVTIYGAHTASFGPSTVWGMGEGVT